MGNYDFTRSDAILSIGSKCLFLLMIAFFAFFNSNSPTFPASNVRQMISNVGLATNAVSSNVGSMSKAPPK
jgi:hypothetical protein